MKDEYKQLITGIFLIALCIGVLVLVKKADDNRFKSTLYKMGLHETEVEYIYEDDSGNRYYCKNGTGYTADIISKL